MFFGIIKTIFSLMVAFIFFSLVFVRNATFEDDTDMEDQDTDREGVQVYPPHMWKGTMMWLAIIYGFINLITIARAF